MHSNFIRWLKITNASCTCRIRLQGEFNEILNITYIRLPRLALDGTTGEYSCEVCQDEAQCVNSTIPVLGRS